MITYKTPWLLLSPMMFICAVAGFGSAMLTSSKKIILQIVGFAVLVGLAFWQYKLSSNASMRYHSDPRNPYIYTHTVRDFDNLIKRIHSASKYSQYETDIPVAFIAKESMWPAPFLLRKYRNVGFYADKLCLTPKYLSKLIKTTSGKSAPEWIDSYVILEAKNLLKYSDIAIKEIVYRLNFPNQSVFYKFFKARTGMTPSEYRNS
jgi:AraC-like DNA-binding protein